eukprot:GHVN01046440.1.p1 GENE.GHVN01046440.1~~GHVN01046440.1.p1  ORF type:complete len:132 (+),score=12.05 GHVN01046440.1:84-479(+)
MKHLFKSLSNKGGGVLLVDAANEFNNLNRAAMKQEMRKKMAICEWVRRQFISGGLQNAERPVKAVIKMEKTKGRAVQRAGDLTNISVVIGNPSHSRRSRAKCKRVPGCPGSPIPPPDAESTSLLRWMQCSF